MISLVLAVAVLTAPPSAPADCPCLLSDLRAAALALELIDEREGEYLFHDPATIDVDLRLVRERHAELWDAPPASDAARWPDREIAGESCSFNRSYCRWLQDHWLLSRDDWIQDAVEDCEQLYEIYDCVRDVGCGYYYITYRRKSLKRLRELIGWEMYESGQLPPCVPLWAFRWIN